MKEIRNYTHFLSESEIEVESQAEEDKINEELQKWKSEMGS